MRVRNAVRLDEAFLWSFGTFSVPAHLWQAMSRYAPWIEPAVLNSSSTVSPEVRRPGSNKIMTLGGD